MRDETRHAELAWRTVRWALGKGGAQAQSWVEAAFDEATSEREAAGSPAEQGEQDLREHGIVGPELRAELRAAAIRDAVVPCARALLASARSVVRAPEAARWSERDALPG